MTKKSTALNYIRIIACIMVIGIHLLGWLSKINNNRISLIYLLTEHIVRIGLPIFFILSAVSLIGESDFLADIKSFYLKKACNIFFPFYIWSSIYYQLSNETLGFTKLSIKSFFTGFYMSFFTSQHFHLWYMYAFLGLVILMPFLKRMVDHLSNKEMEILCGMILAVLALKEYLKIQIDEFYLGSWVSFYIFGAFIFRKEIKKCYPILSFIGGGSIHSLSNGRI